jgi:hypothetical protein
MKRQTGIWIDASKAIIITLDGQKEEKITEIDSDIENDVRHSREGNKGTFSGTHHGSNENQFDRRRKEQMDTYLKSVLTYVKGADELYVFGPAETRTKLEQKINDGKLIDASKLKAVEISDKMTLNQIVAKVKNFYNP